MFTAHFGEGAILVYVKILKMVRFEYKKGGDISVVFYS